MSKYTFVTILLICFFTNGYAQKTLSDYSYIVIPEQYEFLSEVDKYQTNSLTKFLFNKYGFHAFFENEVPENFIICDGLKADVIKTGGIIYTKLQIIINDCHGNKIYRSAEGKSKFKDYNKVFNDALRKAFAGIIDLEVKQKEISFKEDTSLTTEVKNESKDSEEVQENKVVKSSNQETNKETSDKPKFPFKQYNTYKIDNDLFLLRKTDKGYRLYKDVAFDTFTDNNNGLVLLGEVLISNSKVFYLGLNEKLVDAHFDESLNLIIDNPSKKMIYKFID